ncbi:RNA polymerase sigma factor [Mangrovibacterium diazotrophicum]|uniref:RNA polymerase sigma-70 factor (ECF subfamily) n=1 Tax=Mangrovibacterium diazotrophicum TaxID=1261403 RepID=A0A419W372_9BACT|nr:sigma-70 family RNA polymerase sigma factor [Mangrovibacterium diazotrophicum]RKD89927.1 RNA polymerase sigma-70 factor (ECF subfamily) [Mangrovibacterium diazotrophicum]
MQLNPFHLKKKQPTDGQLLQDFRQSGDLDVLGDLYARYMDLVYGLCLKHFKNREDAKDAVIQIFEKLVDEIPKHDIKSFKSWLYVVSKNYCLMELRKAKTGQLRSLADEQELANFMEKAEEWHPIDDEPNKRNEEALKACIEKLKQQQKDCIELFYFENKSYREISAALELEEQKVKSYIQNGKRMLKICLESKQ